THDQLSIVDTTSTLIAVVASLPKDELVPLFRQYLDPHEVRRRISAFAFSHSTNFASPDSIFRSRSANSSSCQAGDSIAAGSTDRICQSASMVCSLSSTLVSYSGRLVTLIAQIISHAFSRSN